ncbi:MAG: hypothetical protein PVF15_08135 [Candidatus Bathyarchaeota archaeon]|jgi:hypothetical protein
MPREKVLGIIVSSLLIWMLSILPLITVAQAQTQDVVIGVNLGDWVRYEYTLVEWKSTQMTPDPEFVELNNTAWFKHEIQDIRDKEIVFSQTTQFRNDTQKTSVFQLDVSNGDGNGTLMYISSGLGAEQKIYPASPQQVLINETITRSFAGATREVNLLILTGAQFTEEDEPNLIYASVSYHWDKETGVLTERLGEGRLVDQTGSQIASWRQSDEIVETNLWTPEEEPTDGQGNEEVYQFPYAIVGGAIVVVVLIGAWRLWPRKRRLKARKSRTRRQAVFHVYNVQG